MFCPNCGANNSTEQKFCRSCGLNLEKSVESLLEQIPSAQSANLLKHERNIEKFGQLALGGLGVVGLIGISVGMWLLVSKLLATGTNIYASILLVAFFVFAVLSLVFVILNEGLKEKKAKVKYVEGEKELSGHAETAKLLEERPFEPVPSVTENSTELLLTKNKTREF